MLLYSAISLASSRSICTNWECRVESFSHISFSTDHIGANALWREGREGRDRVGREEERGREGERGGEEVGRGREGNRERGGDGERVRWGEREGKREEVGRWKEK